MGGTRQNSVTTAVASLPGFVWTLAASAAFAGALLPTPWWQIAFMAVACAVVAWSGKLHAPAFRFGLIAATAFVLLRVGYRVLFTSLATPGADAILVLDLPILTLSGPFRGIAMFGPLTLEQLVATVADSTRFAVVFVLFGAANALADARTLLSRAPAMIAPIASVLSLAFGSVPSLIAAGTRVSFGAKLRSERTSVRLLLPIFEQSVERATALGASMELRGFAGGRAALTPTSSRTVHSNSDRHQHDECPVLSATHVTIQHAGDMILQDVSLHLRAGEMTVITGPTGCGKTTLISYLAGLTPTYTGGSASGVLELRGVQIERPRPAALAGHVALVPQRVEHTFLAETVRAELAFGLTRLGQVHFENKTPLDLDVQHSLERFGIVELAERDPATLSAGEATRVAVAAACAANPGALLLDEPIADLDEASVSLVLAQLLEMLRSGCAVLVSEHRPDPLHQLERHVPMCWVELSDGKLRRRSQESLSTQPPDRQAAYDSQAAPLTPQTQTVASPGDSTDPRQGSRSTTISLARSHQVTRGGSALLWVQDFTTSPGEITLLTGPNGSGKTSLLEDIAVIGTKRAPGIAFVPHRVDDLLIRDTLDAECRHADRRARIAPGATWQRFLQLVSDSLTEPEKLLLRHPRDLSAGTRLALAIAVQLALDPKVLLLDEPTRGLDSAARTRLASLVAQVAAEGRAVVLTTHDRHFEQLLQSHGHSPRRLTISGGALP